MRIKPAIAFKIAAQHERCIPRPPEDMATHLPCGHAKHTRLAHLLGIRTQPLLGFVTCFVIALLLLQQGAQALQALRVIGLSSPPTQTCCITACATKRLMPPSRPWASASRNKGVGLNGCCLEHLPANAQGLPQPCRMPVKSTAFWLECLPGRGWHCPAATHPAAPGDIPRDS